MADIFMSYAGEDRERARTLAQVLEHHGWSMWWDRKIPVGKSFHQVIEEAIDEARCVIVLWSKSSVASDWVRNEAEEGKRRNILCPVMLDAVNIPLGFRHLQAADLSDWQPATPHAEFDGLLSSITKVAGPSTALLDESPASRSRPPRPARKAAQVRAGLVPESSARIIEEAAPPGQPEPDRARLRTKSESARKVIINKRKIRIVRVLAGHTLPVMCLAFSPDGMLIASAAGGGWTSRGDAVRIWGAHDGKLVHTLKSDGPATAVCFSPDGSLVASCGHDISLWNSVDAGLEQVFEMDPYVNCMTFSPDGRTLAAGTCKQNGVAEIVLWRVADNKMLRSFGGHTGTINSIAISPNGDILASGSEDKTMRLWRIEDGKLIATLKHEEKVPSVAFTPDGNTIASCSWEAGIGCIRFRELARRKIIAQIEVDVDPEIEFPELRQIVLSSDDSLVACVVSTTIYLLGRKDGKLVHRLKGPKKQGFFFTTDVEVNCIAFSPDGMQIAAGSDDKMIRLWSLV